MARTPRWETRCTTISVVDAAPADQSLKVEVTSKEGVMGDAVGFRRALPSTSESGDTRRLVLSEQFDILLFLDAVAESVLDDSGRLLMPAAVPFVGEAKIGDCAGTGL